MSPVKMYPEKSSAVINHNHLEEAKRACYKANLNDTTFYGKCIIETYSIDVLELKTAMIYML